MPDSVFLTCSDLTRQMLLGQRGSAGMSRRRPRVMTANSSLSIPTVCWNRVQPVMRYTQHRDCRDSGPLQGAFIAS